MIISDLRYDSLQIKYCIQILKYTKLDLKQTKIVQL